MKIASRTAVNREKIISWAAVVLLGALGSAFWELIKPLLGWVLSATLAIATLGLDSLRDGMYASAGRGLGLPEPLASLSLSNAGLMLVVAVMVVKYLNLPKTSPAKEIAKLIPLMLLTGSVTMLIGAVRSNYVEELTNHFVRLSIIAAPYIDEKETKKLNSEFTRIESRGEYIQKVEKLRSIVRANGVEPPLRDFF
jgi:hypothetical protein